jgi:hypothetical protein
VSYRYVEADHTAVLPIDTCECIAERVHCKGCEGQVGYHVTHVCAFCDRSGHNGHFWIFQSELVKASAIEAEAGGDHESSHKAVGEAAAAVAAAGAEAARAGGSVGGGSGDETTEEDEEGDDVRKAAAAATTLTTTEGCGGGGEVKREEGCGCPQHAPCALTSTPKTPPLLLWSALPYNGAPVATSRLLASTQLTPPASIVCAICASVMHQPVRFKTCGHGGAVYKLHHSRDP